MNIKVGNKTICFTNNKVKKDQLIVMENKDGLIAYPGSFIDEEDYDDFKSHLWLDTIEDFNYLKSQYDLIAD